MRKPAPERKAEIIATAIDLADKVGPDRITTEMIAQKIGVTQATIFRHFPKKEDIWNGVGMLLTGRIREAWERFAGDRGEAVARLEAVVLGHLGLIRQMPALPIILTSRELHVENAPLRRALLGAMGGLQQRLKGLIDEAIAAGTFRKDLEPNDAALLLIALIQFVALHWSLTGRADDLVVTGKRLLAVQLAGFYAGPDDRPAAERAQVGS